MSWEVCTTTTPIAQKEYDCIACEWLALAEWGQGYMEFGDLRKVVKARRENCKILPGTRYIKTCGLWDGDWVTFRARIDMDGLCMKYELYENY